MPSKGPTVTVLVTHHLDENAPYLELCLKALMAQKGVEYEVIVLADTERVPNVPDEFTLVHDRSLDTATKKVHHGIKMAHPESQAFLFLSDDVVMSETCLGRLIEGAMGTVSVVCPMTNGEVGTRYLARFQSELPMRPDMRLEDLWGKERELIEFDSGYHNLVVKQDWISFFCVLIPRIVWNAVGPLDPDLETRHNDQDYCYRAAALGIPSMINLGAFAYHFGSRTLRSSVKAGEQDGATEHFRRKYGVA